MLDNQERIQIIQRALRSFTNTERVNHEIQWGELTEFLLNNQSGTFISNAGSTHSAVSTSNSTPGTKKTQRIYDSTGMQAVTDLAASFQGTITNPATVWSKIRFTDDELNDNREAVKFLEDSNRIMHNKFNESNFDTEIGKGYQSFTCLGNLALLQEEISDDENGIFGGFRFQALHLGQIAWEENKNQLVDTVHRKFEMTAKQAVEKWGIKNLDEKILEALEKKPDTKFPFIHSIFPRKKENVKLNSLGLAPGEDRPFASIYIDATSNNIVKESGYYEFPIHVARWSLMPGEAYGRGPGHLAYPDVRTLNKLKQRHLEAIALQVRPSLLANQRDILGPLNLTPGAINIVKDHQGLREFPTQARTDIFQVTSEELKMSIKSIFFLDKLLLPPRDQTGEMTAYEVSQRTAQMQRVLGPVMSRLNSELLSPLIIRSFKMLLRSGELGPIPQILKEKGIDIEIVFVNSLARAQQIEDIQNIQQLAQQMALMAQIDPSVIDNFDSDAAFKHIAKTIGVPEEVIRDSSEVTQIRQARQQQAKQNQTIQQMNMMADSASKAGLTGLPGGQQ